MDLKLQFIESFAARGSDGATYKVMAYERLRPGEALTADAQEHWEPTGVYEYRLDNGALVDVAHGGSMRVVSSGVVLTRV